MTGWVSRAARGSALGLAALMCACAPFASATSQTSPAGQPVDRVVVPLPHAPTGSVTASVGSPRQVAYHLETLAPGSSHLAELVATACNASAPSVLSFTITATDKGAATGSTSLPPNVAVADGWSVRVHAGPDPGNADQRREIACATLKDAGDGTFAGDLKRGSGGSASGTAELSYDQRTRILTVTVTMHGINPGSTHPNHVHTGGCELQGPVRHVLKPLVADSHGDATAKTDIPEVDRILHGTWYVAVHQGPGLDVPEQFNPIACGNVT